MHGKLVKWTENIIMAVPTAAVDHASRFWPVGSNCLRIPSFLHLKFAENVTKNPVFKNYFLTFENPSQIFQFGRFLLPDLEHSHQVRLLFEKLTLSQERMCDPVFQFDDAIAVGCLDRRRYFPDGKRIRHVLKRRIHVAPGEIAEISAIRLKDRIGKDLFCQVIKVDPYAQKLMEVVGLFFCSRVEVSRCKLLM